MTGNATEGRTDLPLVAHVVYRFDFGGLENGLVNLINATHGNSLRHCVIALTEATDFRSRLRAPDVEVFELGKKPGKDPGVYLRLYRLLRKLRPKILHTRNIGTLDCVFVGRLAGIRQCIHGEHGWDVYDIDGTNRKFRLLRRITSRFVRQFITVSAELEEWLLDSVGIPKHKITRICNGVDTDRFMPRQNEPRHEELDKQFSEDAVIIGSVLRFQEIKDPMNLVNAFIEASPRAQESGVKLRLAMIGDGPLREPAVAALEQAGLSEVTWLPGSRDDIPDLMRSFDVFILGSKREGISNTVLEAMASGLPVIATNTGGNAELIRTKVTGELVEPEDTGTLAEAVLRYACDRLFRERCGIQARETAVKEYSLDAMIGMYEDMYRDEVNARGGK